VAACNGALAAALTGVRQLLFITGEAGLDKTALVEVFLNGPGDLWAALDRAGQCSTLRGRGGLSAGAERPSGACVGAPGGPEVVALLGQAGPDLAAQLPGLAVPPNWRKCGGRMAGATRDRMLRGCWAERWSG